MSVVKKKYFRTASTHTPKLLELNESDDIVKGVSILMKIKFR